MFGKPLLAAIAALSIGLALPLPAFAVRASDPNSGEWTSGYQMGQLWAAVRTPSGDAVRFTCLDEDTPSVKKGVSISIEAAAIAEAQLKPGEPVDVGLGTQGLVKTVAMIVEEGSTMSLADLPKDRADAAKLIVALKTGQVLSVTFGRNALSFGLAKSRKALAGVADCAKATSGG